MVQVNDLFASEGLGNVPKYLKKRRTVFYGERFDDCMPLRWLLQVPFGRFQTDITGGHAELECDCQPSGMGDVAFDIGGMPLRCPLKSAT